MEALLVLLPRKLEGQPHTYLCKGSPLGPHFSWTIPAESHEPANRSRNAAYSQHFPPHAIPPDCQLKARKKAPTVRQVSLRYDFQDSGENLLGT